MSPKHDNGHTAVRVNADASTEARRAVTRSPYRLALAIGVALAVLALTAVIIVLTIHRLPTSL